MQNCELCELLLPARSSLLCLRSDVEEVQPVHRTGKSLLIRDEVVMGQEWGTSSALRPVHDSIAIIAVTVMQGDVAGRRYVRRIREALD